jgi:hypothetical protein
MQRAQRVLASIEVLGLDPDLEADRAARAGRELPGVAAQVARDEREQVARLREGVLQQRATPSVASDSSAIRLPLASSRTG